MVDWCKLCIYDESDAPSKTWESVCYTCEVGSGDLIAPSNFQPRKDVKTHGDEIRNFTDTQLSKYLPNKHMWNCPPDIKANGGCLGACEPCWLRYLQRPAEENSK